MGAFECNDPGSLGRQGDAHARVGVLESRERLWERPRGSSVFHARSATFINTRTAIAYCDEKWNAKEFCDVTYSPNDADRCGGCVDGIAAARRALNAEPAKVPSIDFAFEMVDHDELGGEGG